MIKNIGFYGEKYRAMQRKLSRDAFEMTGKTGCIYQYLGSAANENPSLDDIQSLTFFENPDRAYAKEPFTTPIYVEPTSEGVTDFSRYGIISPVSNEQRVKIHIDHLECMGRLVIIGDIFYIPFYDMFDTHSTYWEVTDVDKSQLPERYYITVSMVPLTDSRKSDSFDIDNSNFDITADIMGRQDEQYESSVPYEELTLEDEEPETPTPVDSRNKKQKSFLDDPTYKF